MIKLLIGSIGSGKSLSAVKEIKSLPMKVYVNFKVKDKDCIRLKMEHIIKNKVVGAKKDGTPITQKAINWEYWNEVKGEPFSIILDEFHNVMHSRQSMSKRSILLSKWLSQIRKVLSDNKKSHLYLISQKLGRIDVAVRDLAQEIIYVEKKEVPKKIETRVYSNNRYSKKQINKIFIIKHHFTGTYCIEKFNAFLMGSHKPDYKTYFLGNPYMQYYDTYELIDFAEEEFL